MAKVFTGKVVIPGDQMEKYFEAVAEAEAARDHRANVSKLSNPLPLNLIALSI